MSLEQATVVAEQVQNQSKASVARSLQMVLEAEQMAKITEEVEDIKANIQRSKKLVGQIARSAASDRCIQMLCVLIAVAIMVMIALAATGRDGGQMNVPDPVRQGGSG